nr:acyl-CoA dehydrogenase family protein [Mycobacterium intracellulare]
MDFTVSDEQRMLVESSRKFLARESLISRVRELADSDERGYDERVWQLGAELGGPAYSSPSNMTVWGAIWWTSR